MIKVLAVLLTIGTPSAEFMDCFYGPLEEVRSDCRRFDYDVDGDIDLRDYQYFQLYGANNMATKYVSAGGNNVNSGDGPAAGDAWASLQYAFDQLSDGNPHTIVLGAGVSEGNTLLSLDATNNGADITVEGNGVGTIGNNSAVQTIYFNTGCATGDFTFQNLTLAHSDTGNSWALRLGVTATDVNITFTNCTLDSSHHMMWSGVAGDFDVTFTDCTITYGSTGYVLTANNTGAVTYTGCTINSDNGGADLVLSSGGNLSGGLTVTNCEVSGKEGAEIINVGGTGNVGDCSITGSIFNHISSTDECLHIASSGTINISNNIFNGGNLAANTISYLNLTTTAGNTINCNDNEFNGVIDPTSEPLAQGFLHAIRISTAAAIDTINILRNNITSGASGIFVDSPSADGIKVNCNYNTVYLTSTASGGAGAQGIHIGETTESPANTFGVCKLNYNYIQYLGTATGTGMRAGRTMVSAGSQQIGNTVINLTSPTYGLAYGFYGVCRNTEIAYNKVYGRSAGTIVGSNGNYIHHNAFVTPNQGSKACASFTKHDGGSEVTNSIVEKNFFLIHAVNGSGEVDAYQIEGDSPSDLTWDSNYYGIQGFDVGSVSVGIQDIQSASGQVGPPLEDVSAGWVAAGMSADNDANSIVGTGFALNDPANGDFGVTDEVAAILCAAGLTDIGPEAFTCLPDFTVTYPIQQGFDANSLDTSITDYRATRVTSNVTDDNATEVQWQFSLGGDPFTFRTNTNGIVGTHTNILESSLYYLDMWLPPSHTFTVRTRLKIDGVWGEWTEWTESISLGYVNSYDKYQILNRATTTTPT